MRHCFLPLATLTLLSTLLSNLVFAVKTNVLREQVASTSTTNSTSMSWIFPSSASISAFNSVDTMQVQWQSSYTNANLKLWCKRQSAGKFMLRNNVNVATTGTRAVLLDYTQDVDTLVCHFMLQDLANLDTTSTSPAFSIQNAPNAKPQTWSANGAAAPITSISPSDLAAPTATWTGSPYVSSSSASSATASSSSPAISGLSTDAGAGIGIGVAVVAVALVVGVLLLFLRARRRKVQQPDDMPNDGAKGMSQNRQIRAVSGIHETIGNRPIPQELEASGLSGESGVTLVRSEFERNEAAAYSPAHLDASGRRESARSVGSSIPESMSGRPTERDGNPI